MALFVVTFESQYEHLFAMAQASPTRLRELVLDESFDALVREDALSLLTARDVQTVVDVSVAAGTVGPLLRQVGLQLPGALTPHLPHLWPLQTDRGRRIESLAWREADQAEISRLVDVVDTHESPFVREFAASCLIQTRRPAAWDAVVARLACLPYLPKQTVGDWLLKVGIQWRPGYRRLTTDDVYHLASPNECLAHPQPLWRDYWHPTWAEPDPQFASAVFDGRSETVCTLCMQPMRRLLLLDPPVATLGITSRNRIDIAYCDTCTGAETSFHHHSDDGAPTLISAPDAVFPFQGEPRPAVRVGLTNLGPRWATQEWSNGRQNLNRLGGEPAWIQQPDYPSCPTCDTLMMHIGQLDWDHLDNGERMSYIFWCDTCAVSALTYQQT